MKSFLYESMSENVLYQHEKFLLMNIQRRDYCWDDLEPELFQELQLTTLLLFGVLWVLFIILCLLHPHFSLANMFLHTMCIYILYTLFIYILYTILF